MNCPFLINENKVITKDDKKAFSSGVYNIVISQERWFAPCMKENCPYYDELTKLCRRIEWKR